MSGGVTEGGNEFVPATDAELSRFFSFIRKEDDAQADLERSQAVDKKTGKRIVYPALVKGGCWMFVGNPGSKSNHPKWRFRDKVVFAHRWYYGQREKKVVPDEMVVDQACHDRRVCNVPARQCPHRRCVRHTREVTNFENTNLGARAAPQPPKPLLKDVTPIQARTRVVTGQMSKLAEEMQEVKKFLPRGYNIPRKIAEWEDEIVWSTALGLREREREALERAKFEKMLASRPPPAKTYPLSEMGQMPRLVGSVGKAPSGFLFVDKDDPDVFHIHDPPRVGDAVLKFCDLINCQSDYALVLVRLAPEMWLKWDPYLGVPHERVCCKRAGYLSAHAGSQDLGYVQAVTASGQEVATPVRSRVEEEDKDEKDLESEEDGEEEEEYV